MLLVQRRGVKKNERRRVGRAWRAVDDLHRDGAIFATVLQAAIDLEDTRTASHGSRLVLHDVRACGAVRACVREGEVVMAYVRNGVAVQLRLARRMFIEPATEDQCRQRLFTLIVSSPVSSLVCVDQEAEGGGERTGGMWKGRA
jgi:hypothetical protein